MSNIAASDVTYLMLNERTLGNSLSQNRVRLSFGDGALTYPAGGIPISKGKLGCPNDIQSMTVVDQGTSGYKFMYDQSAEKLVIIQGASHTHDVLIKGGQAAASTAATAWYSTDIFGKEAATDKTIAGSASATKGGVMASTAVAGSEASTVAIAAQIIEVEVIGW